MRSWGARNWLRWFFAVAFVAALVALPAYASYGTLRLMVEVLTVFAIAMAWNLMAGYGGLVAVGQHAFVGVGAYALFVASNNLGLNPWLALPLAATVSGLFAVLSAWPLFRLSGAYFAVATWVVAELLRIGATNSEWLGAGGGLPLLAMREFERETRNVGVYWAALAVGLSALLAGIVLLRSRLGLALMSVRDSEAAATASGVPVQRVKLALWVVTGIITGSAGAVAYMSTLQVSPDAAFGLNWTAMAIFIVVLGGIGSLEGPIIGVLIYFALREAASDYGAWYFVGLGSLAIAGMLVAPSGVWGILQRLRPGLDPFLIRRRMR